MSPSARLALLALGVSALPLIAHAEPARPQWVYGGGASEDAASNFEAWWAFADTPASGGLLGHAALVRTPSPPPSPPRPAPTPGLGGPTIVAVIDTGIDLDHPEFTGRILSGTCVAGVGACDGAAARGDDDNGHGTHVAGIIAAASNGTGTTGVAPNATLLAIKALDANGSGDTNTVALGLRAASAGRARVINLSLGGPAGDNALFGALQLAARNSVIVAAAGNQGNAFPPDFPAGYATQAGVVGSMIIAGSVDAANQISSFSQTPGTGGCVLVTRVTTCFKDVFLVAPGENILSTFPGGGYYTASGTSMATPYISGVAARVFSASPYLTPQQVVSILLRSATDLGAPGTDSVYGRGLVNLTAALAPLGAQRIATSGVTTASFASPGDAARSGLSGVLAMGLRGSQVAKDAMFFDDYGRDYRTDLTAAVAFGGVSLDGLVAQTGLFRSVAFESNRFSVSGFVSGEAPNMVSSVGLANGRYTEIGDLVLKTRLGEGASLTVGRDASLEGRINSLDIAASRAFDGLFLSASALNSPYLGLTDGATFVAGSVQIGDDLTLTAGHAQTTDRDRFLADGVLGVEEVNAYLTQDLTHVRSADNTVAAATWRFASWGLAGLSAAHTSERNSLLGTLEQGALALTSDAATDSVQVGTRVNLGGNWVVNASWSYGETSATPVADGLLRSVSGLRSQAYGFALSKHSVIGDDDTMGFAVSRPLHVTSGTAIVTASTGVNEAREILYSTEVLNLASLAPETAYELGYGGKLGDSTGFQVSAIYQQDAGGQAGADAIAAFLTLKTSW